VTDTLPIDPLPGEVVLDDVGKVHGQTVALDGVHLDVAPGELVCFVGASGCGKTTLLNLVARLDSPSSGTVRVGGRAALMFQEAALFPWLTVQRNVELALKLRGVARAARRERALELLHLVRLADVAHARPHELSGGMRQRVALARALAQDADVLLMDEPFGALDAMTRAALHAELERVWATTGATILFVTHDVREAVRLADRIVVLASRPGRVVAELPVLLPRPREDGPEALQLANEVTHALHQEVIRHGRG
jgi:NitT/TauT family transport system ATP-binding protein